MSSEKNFTFLWKIETFWELVLNCNATLRSPVIKAADAEWILEMKIKEQLMKVEEQINPTPICKFLCLRLRNVKSPPEQIDCELSLLATDDTVLRRFRVTEWKADKLCVDCVPWSEISEKCLGSLRVRCQFGLPEGRTSHARSVFSSGSYLWKEQLFYRVDRRYFKTSEFQLGSRSFYIKVTKSQQFPVDKTVEIKIFFKKVDDLQFVHCKACFVALGHMKGDFLQAPEFLYSSTEKSWSSLIPLRPDMYSQDKNWHFKFEVTIAKEESWIDPPFPKVLRDVTVGTPPSSNLKDSGVKCLIGDLARMHGDRKFCDVTLTSSSGEEFLAHRNILSVRSPLFRAKFEEDDALDTVPLPDVDSRTLSTLLQYAYSGRADKVDDWKDAFNLHQAARDYGFRDLQRECQSFLVSNLDVQNVYAALALCSPDPELMASACEFVRDHEDEVMASRQWKKLEEKNPRLIITVLKILNRKK